MDVGEQLGRRLCCLDSGITEEEEEEGMQESKVDGGELLVYTLGIFLELLAPAYSFEPFRS